MEIAVGLFQLIVEGSLSGGCNTIHSGGNGVFDIQSVVPAGSCNLITNKFPVVGEDIHLFGASIVIGEEPDSFATGKHYEAWIQKIIVLLGSFCVAKAIC